MRARIFFGRAECARDIDIKTRQIRARWPASPFTTHADEERNHDHVKGVYIETLHISDDWLSRRSMLTNDQAVKSADDVTVDLNEM